MFTGLVAAIGRLHTITARDGGLDLVVTAPFEGLALGESIAVNGACLTVAAIHEGGFAVHVVRTSLDRTTFEGMAVGDTVNLERALRVTDRLGGHFVQGHVDGIGEVLRVEDRDDARLLDLRVPDHVARLSFPRGSIAVDGVSMTVNEVLSGDELQLSVVPYTLEHTTLGERRVGDRVHLEADMLGKFVERLESWQKTASREQ